MDRKGVCISFLIAAVAARASAASPSLEGQQTVSESRGPSGKPAYETETWPEARLLVWARPGQDGKFDVAANWLEGGKPAAAPPDKDADVYLPAAAKCYTVSVDSNKACRHATVDKNARLMGGQHVRDQLFLYGNGWAKEGGRLCSLAFLGDKHTFFRADGSQFPRPGDPAPYIGAGSYQATSLEKHPSSFLGHRVRILKGGKASVEFIGNYGMEDEFTVAGGKLIINGELRYNGTTGKGDFEVFEGATVELQSGSTLAAWMHTTPIGNVNIYAGGTLQAGSPERPLTKDAFILLSFMDGDPSQKHTGFYCAEEGAVRTYTTDPQTARLVFSSISSRADFADAVGRILGKPEEKAQGQKGILVQLGGEAQFNGVHFDYVHEGGIRLAAMESVKKWSAVSFGPHNAGPPEKLYGPMVIRTNLSKRDRLNLSNLMSRGKGLDVYESRLKEEFHLKAEMRGASADAFQVTLTSKGEEIRYTLDGNEPTILSPKYVGPFTVPSGTIVLAKARKGDNLSLTLRVVAMLRDPVRTAGSGKGFVYQIYPLDRAELEAKQGSPFPDFSTLKPSTQGTLDRLEIPKESAEAFGVVYTGFVSVPKDDLYMFHLNANAGGRLTLGDALVVDIPGSKHQRGIRGGRQIEGNWLPGDRSGCIGLKAGLHPLRLHYYTADSKKALLKLSREGPDGAKEAIADPVPTGK